MTGERKMTNMQKHRNRETGPWTGVGGRQWGHWSVCEPGMSSHQQCWKPASLSSPHSCPNQITSVTMRFGEGFLKLDENHSCYFLLQPKNLSLANPKTPQTRMGTALCRRHCGKGGLIGAVPATLDTIRPPRPTSMLT